MRRARAPKRGDDGALDAWRTAGEAIDGIMLSFVVSYLDTHEVHRLIAQLAQRYPRATLIAALTFRSCVDRRESVEPDEAGELRAARRYLAGHPAAAEVRWDVRRLVCYRQSVERYYRIVEERTLAPLAQMLWVAKCRAGRRTPTRTLHDTQR